MVGLVYGFIGIGMMVLGDPPVKKIGLFYVLGPIFMGIVGFVVFFMFAKWMGKFEVEIKDIDKMA